MRETIASDGRRSRCAEDILGESVFYTEPENRRRPDVYTFANIIIIIIYNDIIFLLLPPLLPRNGGFFFYFLLFSFYRQQPFFSALVVLTFPPRIRRLSVTGGMRSVARNTRLYNDIQRYYNSPRDNVSNVMRM